MAKASVDTPSGAIGVWMKRLLVALVVVGALSLGAFVAMVQIFSRDLPKLDSLQDYNPPVTSEVFDRKGKRVARFYDERRTVVPIEKIPKHVRDAFIAAEDADFYDHGGIDYPAVAAVLLNEVKIKLLGGGRRRGGSTITQQTAKTFLLSPEQTYRRKAREMLLAKKIEEKISKEDILYLYLNQIYFGHGAYGIEEAAQTYYGVSVDKLTVGQAAVLASVPKAPNRINPFTDPARVRERRAYVLKQMLEHKMIDDARMQKALKEPVRVHHDANAFLGVGPYYAEEVRRQLVEKYGADVVNKGGLKVYTAMDAAMQEIATDAVQEGLREVDKRQGYRGPLVRLDPDEARDFVAALDEERKRRFPAEETPELANDKTLAGRPIWTLARLDKDTLVKNAEAALRKVRTKKLKEGLIVGGLVTEVSDVKKKVVVDLGTVTGSLHMADMNWARPWNPERQTKAPRKPSQIFKEGDVVLVRVESLVTGKKDKEGNPLKPWVELKLEQDPKVEGAFVAIDPHNHRVRALVGGYRFSRSSFNRATQAKRQPGSAFKPFIYGRAIASKQFTPLGFHDDEAQVSRFITDAPKNIFDRWTGKPWRPKNAGNRYRGDISMRTCLTHSVNTCSVTLLEKIGVEDVVAFTQSMGMLEGLPKTRQNLTLALGTAEVHPLNLINGYTIFPGEGMWAPPVLVEKVKTKTGEVLPLPNACPEDTPDCNSPKEVMSKEAAYVMAEMMTSVVEDGTGKRAKALGRPVAGKTGTTNKARTVWFVGYTPSLVAGAYVGFDDNKPLGHREYGGKAALPIWLKFMEEATRGQEKLSFQKPDGVVKVAIDRRTGLVANEETVTDAPAVPIGEGDATMAAASAEAAEPSESDGSPDAEVAEATADGDDVGQVVEVQLPDGAYWEVFIDGTQPMVTVSDRAPDPLEMMEGKGGLLDL